MEGNDIEDLGGGQFRTVRRGQALQPARSVRDGAGAAVRRADVLLRGEPGLARTSDRRSAPSMGVSFTGTRRDVLIEDMIAVMGQRLPAAADSAKVHRQAFIYVVTTAVPSTARRSPSSIASAAVGDVLPAGDGEPHDRGHAAALTQPASRPQEMKRVGDQ